MTQLLRFVVSISCISDLMGSKVSGVCSSSRITYNEVENFGNVWQQVDSEVTIFVEHFSIRAVGIDEVVEKNRFEWSGP
jgi:hypothetical protein